MIFDYHKLSFSIIFGDFNTVSEEFIELFMDKKNWKYEYIPVNIKQIYYPDIPYGVIQNEKVLLWETPNKKATVLFSNVGWYNMLLHYSSVFKRTGIKIIISDTYNCKWPSFFFKYVKEGKAIRKIHSIKENRWVFYQDGNLLDFEKEDYYRKRRITDRLNEKIITEYLDKLGFDIQKEEFWKPQATGLFLEEKYKEYMSDEEALEMLDMMQKI